MSPSLSPVSPAPREFLHVDPREALFARSPHCAYCGKRFRRIRGTTADHIHPRSRGGRTSLSNLALACRRCNVRKDNLTATELVRWTARVVLVALVARLRGAR